MPRSRGPRIEPPEVQAEWQGVFQRVLAAAAALVTCETLWLVEAAAAGEAGARAGEMVVAALERRAKTATSTPAPGQAAGTAAGADGAAAKSSAAIRILPRHGSPADAAAMATELRRHLRLLARDAKLPSAVGPAVDGALARLCCTFDVTRAPVTAAHGAGSALRLTTPQWRALAVCMGWVCRGLAGAGAGPAASTSGTVPALSTDERAAWGAAIEAQGLSADEFRHVCDVLRGGVVRPLEGVAAASIRASPAAADPIAMAAAERVRAARAGELSDAERERVAEVRMQQALAARVMTPARRR